MRPIVITNGTAANINRCWIEVYYIPPSLFSHITLPLTLFNSFYLFLSSPLSQTLWNTVPAAQAPCLCLAASCLKQASRLTPSTSTTPAATAHSKMAEWSSSSTMRITLVEPLWGYNSFYTKDLQNKLFLRGVLSWSVNLWAKPKYLAKNDKAPNSLNMFTQNSQQNMDETIVGFYQRHWPLYVLSVAQQSNSTHFIYENLIQGEANSAGGPISRERRIQLLFCCVYPLTQALSMDMDINPLERLVLPLCPHFCLTFSWLVCSAFLQWPNTINCV